MLTDKQLKDKSQKYVGSNLNLYKKHAKYLFDASKVAYIDGYKAAQEDMKPRRIGELDKEYRGYIIGYTKIEKKHWILDIESVEYYHIALHYFSHFFIPPTLKQQQ
jgi:hypothetical protein